MQKYPWAQNRQKLERAIGELGPDASEEALKVRYIEMYGLVLEQDGTSHVEAPEVVTTEPVSEPVSEEETPVEKPKKAVKKTTKK